MKKRVKNKKKEINFTFFIIIVIIVLILFLTAIDISVNNIDLTGKARDAYKGASNPNRSKYNSSEGFENSTFEKLSITHNKIQEELKAIKNVKEMDSGIIDLIKTVKNNMEEAAYCEEGQEAIGYKYNFQPDLEKIEYVYCIDVDSNNGNHPFKQSSSIYYYSMFDITPDYSVFPSGPEIQAPTEYNILEQGCHKIQDKCKTEQQPFLYEAECDPVKKVPTFRVIDCIEKFGEDYTCINGACVEVTEEPVIIEECGNNILDADEECDDGNQENGDGCSEECENEIPPPDLIIGIVNNNAASEYCVNFYVFEICNIGVSTVEDNIEISIQANGETSVFEYDPIDGLEPFECDLIKNPPKTHIFKFTNLDSTDDVMFTVDPDDEIDEADETNNFKLEQIYSGDNYYYEPNNFEEDNVCSTWCYDSDDGKNWWQTGTTSFLYNQEMGSKTDACDKHYGYPNQAVLTEYYCLSPIYKLDNGLFPYPALSKELDCTLFDAKCENGACVSIDENYLSCQDLEGDPNAWTYGEVLYTSIDGEDSILQDTCIGNNEKVKDYYCEDDQLADTSIYNCVYYNAICENGACVPVDEQNFCQDNEPENDPFIFGTLEFNKFTGETDYHEDDCSFDRHEVYQNYCTSVNEPPQSMSYDCTQSTNEFGASLCVSGKCVYPNPDLMTCDETGDDGLDYYNKGYINSISMHGVGDQNMDTCLPGGNLLVEYFCVGEELHMAEPYDCGLEGMTCYNGRCTTPDENLKFCEEVTTNEGITQIQYINEFGLSTWLEATCIDDYENFNNLDVYNFDDDKESNTLVTFSCNDNDIEYEITDCNDMGGVCYEDQCVIPNFDLVSCESPVEENNGNDPFIGGYTDQINEFGIEKTKYDNCDDEYELQEYYCDGNEYAYDIIDCNNFGMKCNDNVCQEPNPDLIACEEYSYSDEESKVQYTNDFGENKNYYDKCIHDSYAYFLETGEPDSEYNGPISVYNQEAQYLLHYSCNEDYSIGKNAIDCEEQGQICYNGFCVTPNAELVNCEDFTGENNEADPQDPFLSGFSKVTNIYGQEAGYWDYCKDDETVGEIYCNNNEIFTTEIDCTQYNLICNDMTGSCEEYDESLITCFKSDNGDPNIPGYGYIIDGFGNMDDDFDKCKGSNQVFEGSCIDTTPNGETITCDPGKECRKFCDENDDYIGSACTSPDNEENICIENEPEIIEEAVDEEP